MPGGELPSAVERFCLVGRILERHKGSYERFQTGVVRYHVLKFGAGQQHDGLPVFYGPGGGEGDAKGQSKAQRVPMDVDAQFTVFWEGQEEPEVLSLEEVQQLATDRFVDEQWLPPGIRNLIQDGWSSKWSSLSMDNMRSFLDEARNEHNKELAAAKRQLAAADRKGQAPRKAQAARGAKGKAAAAKEDAPLVAADGVAAALEAKKAARKRKAMEASAAAAAAGSPSKRVSLSGRLARLPGAPAAPAAARATSAAAAAATMEPSSGHTSPGGHVQAKPPAAVAAQRRQQARQEVQQQQQGAASSSLSPAQQQQQRSGGNAAGAAGRVSSGSKSKQTLLSPGPSRKAAPSKPKAATVVAATAAQPRGSKARAAAAAGAAAAAASASPAKSGSRRRMDSAEEDIPKVLRQHELEAVAPKDSACVHKEMAECEELPLKDGSKPKVFWYDRVITSDRAVHRVYSQSLVVPDALCFRSKDRRLRTWKTRPQGGGDYVVDAVLAEDEDEDGDLRYLVKWKGYEADPDEDGWLYEIEMTQCAKLLKEWKLKDRAAWEAARKQLLQEAGLA
ncbi:hypothetical protein ABPG77_004100 [Micractinium sp. CCAP 211/92]